MDFLVENEKEPIKMLSFNNAPGSWMKDMLVAVSRAKEEDSPSSVERDLSTMRVSCLRKMLHKRGLDIDGSRETMISRLEENASD